MAKLTTMDQERLVDHGTSEADLAQINGAVNRIMNNKQPWFLVHRLVLVKKNQVDFSNQYRPMSEAGCPVSVIYTETKPNGNTVQVLAEHRTFEIQARNQPEALSVADAQKYNIEVARGFHNQPARRS
jgi:hypothetical protein